MKILIAPDKFKGALTASEVIAAISSGISSVLPDITLINHPLADGGEGSLDTLAQSLHLEQHFAFVEDPLGRWVNAPYFHREADNSCWLESAAASGLQLLEETEANPLFTSSFGTGHLIKQSTCNRVHLFLGGSATNDCGLGIASALGVLFLNRNDEPMIPNGGNLLEISDINIPAHNYEIQCYCDVKNPFSGKSGAVYSFARQKGASDRDLGILERGMNHIAELIFKLNKKDITTTYGAGAAGGIAAGLAGLLDAKSSSGIDFIINETQLENKVIEADVVISGEGLLDEESLNGKVISGVHKLCEAHKKPLCLFVGDNHLASESDKFRSVNSCMQLAQNKADSIKNCPQYLRELAIQFTKLTLAKL